MVAATDRRAVFVTGFGRFGDVDENPTTLVAQAVATHADVALSRVLEVSAKACDEELAELHAKAEAVGRPAVVLHLGLSAVAQGFKLERAGYNVADFRIPDERGWVARDEVIAPGAPEALDTRVPVDELLDQLRGLDDRASVSTDPGRYICNYVYFKSLLWAEQHPETLVLFLHGPKLDVLSLDDQVAFVSRLIELLAAL